MTAIQTALAEIAEFYRVDASSKLDSKRQSRLGQYMTPVPIGRFMASLFSDVSGDLRVLDPGAGVGSLTAAFVERLYGSTIKPRSVSLVCYEIDPLLIGYLSTILKKSELRLESAHVQASSQINAQDFIMNHPAGQQTNLFQRTQSANEEFTHVIMNPPYKKIHSSSDHRAALRRAGIETSNLYTGFMFFAAQRLRNGGEMVAIVPRSFCNGPYFKPFRKQFFSMMGLQHIHVFERRDSAFSGDDVLQENVIIHAVKEAEPTKVRITVSKGAGFELDLISEGRITDDMTQRVVDYTSVIRPNDPDKFLHITTNNPDQRIVERMGHFKANLADIGLEVSTGPVVDFRMKAFLRTQPEKGAVPLLYASHFQGGKLEWPKNTKKPNAIQVTDASRKWLWPNRGHFVVTRRFTSKEERRRIVASVYESNLPGELVGFENHLNVYHTRHSGFSQPLAIGLSAYLNSSLVDRYFRQFNGHTQVNATDLRVLPYPERAVLERIGKKADGIEVSQQEIDSIIESEFATYGNR